MPFSPLGRGLLTGQPTTIDALDAADGRRHYPRFQGDNFDHNADLVEQLRDLATRKHCTPGQLALAWVLARGSDVVPIPGTKRQTHLAQNIVASTVQLTTSDLLQLERLCPPGVAAGARSRDALADGYGDSPAQP